MIRSKQQGFTLIEILIVIAILGIIAAIAVPTWDSQIRKGRRADAVVAATQAAQALERCFTRADSYERAQGCGVDALDTPNSPDGYYVVMVPDASVTVSTYEIQVRPATAAERTHNTQRSDERCQLYTLNNRGVKGALSAGGQPTTDECWRR